EVPLANGRRADLMAISPKGELPIVEIKVSKADLLGDQKWTAHPDYCDRFLWAVPHALAQYLEEDRFLPCDAGLLIADRYDAVVMREPSTRIFAPPRGTDETSR